jgi:arabinofuranosyltransferase
MVLLRIASEAWIGEDALITFRTIDNFVSGYGLRWNIDERVQVFTNPLWMFVNTAAYVITREIPYTLTTLSLVLSVAAYFAVARRLMGRPAMMLMGLFIPFVASKSLVLYGTSGFETPLAFFLLALFTLALLPEDNSHLIRWGWLALYTALAAVNRLDHILLYAPSLIYLCVTKWSRVRWGRLALGMTPLAVWLLFSLLYYGFLFPNTARAKLCAEIPVGHYVREGVIYTANLIRWDPVSAPILVLALAIAGSAVVRSFSKRGNTQAGRLAALSAGVFLYGGYILWIGGGFLSGRFWAPPLFAAILVIVFGSEDLVKHLRTARTRATAASVACLTVLLFAVYALALGLKCYQWRGPILSRSLAHLYLKPDLT